MNTLDSLLANIDANPTDKLLWGVVTDHLEEIGDGRSVGMRWLIEEGKYPRLYKSMNEWSWWEGMYAEENQHCNLPNRIWTILVPTKMLGDYSDKNFYKLSEALLAAAEAYSLFLKESENVLLNNTSSGDSTWIKSISNLVDD